MAEVSVNTETLLPVLFDACPEARAVFNRYGLRGCGGEHGPAESVGFFASAHGVDPDTLLAEVREVIDDPGVRTKAAQQLEADARPRLADSIYRPFFLAGLLVILTLGAGWGVLLLLRIGAGGSFTGVTVHEVNAHGHAQIAGWVGLFIMGFAYQAFPRMWHVELPRPRLALASLVLVLAGIVSRGVAMMSIGSGWATPLHGLGVGFEVLAACAFLGLIAAAFVHSRQRLTPSSAFILTALVFFLIQTLMSGWHISRLMSAPSRDALLAQIGTYQGPLRDVQIHGMAMLMILGVGLRMFPPLFGFRDIRPRRAWWSYGLLVAAVVLEAGLFLAFRATENRSFAVALLAPWLMLPIGAWLLVGGWAPRKPGPGVTPDRSRKFIVAAFVWLFVSFALLLAMPLYLALYTGEFSHAYHGAIRHAITVGFVSLMIMGMGARVVATLNGLDAHRLTTLRLPFLLVNAGCFLRVVLQVWTDWQPGAFSIIGLSGGLELLGLGLWAWHLAWMMVKARAGGEQGREPPPPYLASYHTVGETVSWFPETVETLSEQGFAPIRNPLLRRTVARGVTLAQAAAIGKVPLTQLLAALNERIGASGHDPDSSHACAGVCSECHVHCAKTGTEQTFSSSGGG